MHLAYGAILVKVYTYPHTWVNLQAEPSSHLVQLCAGKHVLSLLYATPNLEVAKILDTN